MYCIPWVSVKLYMWLASSILHVISENSGYGLFSNTLNSSVFTSLPVMSYTLALSNLNTKCMRCFLFISYLNSSAVKFSSIIIGKLIEILVAYMELICLLIKSCKFQFFASWFSLSENRVS